MNEARLAELERRLEWHVANPGTVGVDLSQWLTQALHELIDEVRRLRTRDEWLTVLLGRALVYVDDANMPASWELGDEIRLAISKRENL